MVDAVTGFLVYHASLGQRVLPLYFNFEPGSRSNYGKWMVSMQKARLVKKL